MTLIEEMTELGIPVDWWILYEALTWPSSSPLLTSEAAQSRAAMELASDPSIDADGLLLAVAILRPDDRDETLVRVRELAEEVGTEQETALSYLLLILICRELSGLDCDNAIDGIVRILDLFALAEYPETMPLSVQSWRDGTIQPEEFFSDAGCERLRNELKEWRDQKLAWLSNPEP